MATVMRRCLFVLLLLVGTVRAQMVSPLAKAPNWQELERFQETMTWEEFVQLLDGVYAPRQAAKPRASRNTTQRVVRIPFLPVEDCDPAGFYPCRRGGSA